MRCDRCRWFVHSDCMSQVSTPRRGEELGTCHRYPPVATASMFPNQVNFPTVDTVDYCGEFESRKVFQP